MVAVARRALRGLDLQFAAGVAAPEQRRQLALQTAHQAHHPAHQVREIGRLLDQFVDPGGGQRKFGVDPLITPGLRLQVHVDASLDDLEHRVALLLRDQRHDLLADLLLQQRERLDQGMQFDPHQGMRAPQALRRGLVLRHARLRREQQEQVLRVALLQAGELVVPQGIQDSRSLDGRGQRVEELARELRGQPAHDALDGLQAGGRLRAVGPLVGHPEAHHRRQARQAARRARTHPLAAGTSRARGPRRAHEAGAEGSAGEFRKGVTCFPKSQQIIVKIRLTAQCSIVIA